MVVLFAPLRFDPAALLEAVEGRVQGSLIHLEHFPGYLPDALGDAPAVHGFQRNGFEDQEIQSALDQIGWFAHSRSL